jgi:hypothetical protein
MKRVLFQILFSVIGFFFICLFLLKYGLLIRTYPSLAWSFFGIPGRRNSWLHLDMTRFLGYPSFRKYIANVHNKLIISVIIVVRFFWRWRRTVIENWQKQHSVLVIHFPALCKVFVYLGGVELFFYLWSSGQWRSLNDAFVSGSVMFTKQGSSLTKLLAETNSLLVYWPGPINIMFSAGFYPNSCLSYICRYTINKHVVWQICMLRI